MTTKEIIEYCDRRSTDCRESLESTHDADTEKLHFLSGQIEAYCDVIRFVKERRDDK